MNSRPHLSSKIFLAPLAILAFALAPIAKGEQLPSIADLVEEVSDIVVNVEARHDNQQTSNNDRDRGSQHPPNSMEEFYRHFFGQPRRNRPNAPQPSVPQPRSSGRGSGFIVSRDGYILTNYHVVEGASEVMVSTHDRRQFDAEVIGLDSTTDLALLKIDAKDLPFARLGHTKDLRIGDWVVAIGSPFGFENSVTSGVVSAKSRGLSNRGIGRYVPFIQTDVAINPGNSGGPLFGLDGKVYGMNSQILTRSGGYMGISFSIPAEVVSSVFRQLRDDGQVRRGWLGVSVQAVTADLTEAMGLERAVGALVSDVVKDSPAQAAGLLSGDVITSVDGTPISNFNHLPPAIGLMEPDSDVKLEIYRNGKRQYIQVTLGELGGDGDTQILSAERNVLGFSVESITEDELETLDLEHGVRVGTVESSNARAVGIRRGDIIRSINGQTIESVRDFQGILDELSDDKPVWIALSRGNARLIVTLRPNG